MSKELVIGSNRHETKVAILEEDQLVEVYFQRANEYSLAGSIHKGRVTRVLPGMQSAFVDLGLERDTFLYVSDFFEEHDDIDTLTDDKPVAIAGGSRGGDRERGCERGGPDRERAPQEVFAPALEAHAEALDEVPAIWKRKTRATAPSVSSSPSLAGEVRAVEQQQPPAQQQLRPSAALAGTVVMMGVAVTGVAGDPAGAARGGRDFPENKYARPGVTPPAVQASEPVERARGSRWQKPSPERLFPPFAKT